MCLLTCALICESDLWLDILTLRKNIDPGSRFQTRGAEQKEAPASCARREAWRGWHPAGWQQLQALTLSSHFPGRVLPHWRDGMSR